MATGAVVAGAGADVDAGAGAAPPQAITKIRANPARPRVIVITSDFECQGKFRRRDSPVFGPSIHRDASSYRPGGANAFLGVNSDGKLGTTIRKFLKSCYVKHNLGNKH